MQFYCFHTSPAPNSFYSVGLHFLLSQYAFMYHVVCCVEQAQINLQGLYEDLHTCVFPYSCRLLHVLFAGITWPWVRDLQEHYDEGFKNSEPSVVSNAIGDRVHITFTSSFYDKQWSMRRRSKIVHMSVSTQWIKGEWKNGVSSIGAFKGDASKRY